MSTGAVGGADTSQFDQLQEEGLQAGFEQAKKNLEWSLENKALGSASSASTSAARQPSNPT